MNVLRNRLFDPKKQDQPWRKYSPGGIRRRVRNIPFNGQQSNIRAMGTKVKGVLSNKNFSYMENIIEFKWQPTRLVRNLNPEALVRVKEKAGQQVRDIGSRVDPNSKEGRQRIRAMRRKIAATNVLNSNDMLEATARLNANKWFNPSKTGETLNPTGIPLDRPRFPVDGQQGWANLNINENIANQKTQAEREAMKGHLGVGLGLTGLGALGLGSYLYNKRRSEEDENEFNT